VVEQKPVDESRFKFEDLDLKPHQSQGGDEQHITMEEAKVDSLVEEHLKTARKKKNREGEGEDRSGE
jgi:hypothetical protein